MKILKWYFAVGLLALGVAQPALGASQKFYLRDGDRVLFYGDSITQQRYWTVAVETYVRTRFPDLQVKFLNCGVNGARITGNSTAPADLSLERDVFPFKPTIVTIMLGMNDGGSRPFDQTLFNTYAAGYEHVVQSLKAHMPGVKIVLIEPTPWDDVTREPFYSRNPDRAPGGYDSVISRYAKFVRKLGAENHLQVVDFHTPLVKLMEEAKKVDPALAVKIIPDRVHPGPAGQLVMAQTMLKAWRAPATVSRVAINAPSSTVDQSDNTSVTDLSAANGQLTWTETDKSLPYPIMTLHSAKWPQFPPMFGGNQVFWPLPPLSSPDIDPMTAMVTKLARMYQALDSETLRVSGLKDGDYTLKVDGQAVGKFSNAQLAHGINLAECDTPMMEQAHKVLTLAWHRENVHFYSWRAIQVSLRNDATPGIQQAVSNMLEVLNREQNDLVDQAHSAAQPQAHHYELTSAAQ